jgi:hypothetical protein
MTKQHAQKVVEKTYAMLRVEYMTKQHAQKVVTENISYVTS